MVAAANAAAGDPVKGELDAHCSLKQRWAMTRAERSACGETPVESMLGQLSVLDPYSVEFIRLRDRIVERCLPIADNLARRFEGRGEPGEDLAQVARIGLVNAVMRYDAGVGSGFLAFAVPTIVGEVRRHFRDNCWSLKVPRRYKDLYPQLSALTEVLSQRLGRAPTATELSAEVGISRDEVIEALVAGSAYSTWRVDGDADTGAVAPAVIAAISRMDAALDQIDDREVLRTVLDDMPARERTVLIFRFFGSMTQTQIAERIGISQTHVSRLLTKSLDGMRDRLYG